MFTAVDSTAATAVNYHTCTAELLWIASGTANMLLCDWRCCIVFGLLSTLVPYPAERRSHLAGGELPILLVQEQDRQGADLLQVCMAVEPKEACNRLC